MKVKNFMCFKCKATAEQTALFRQNAKGEDPIWACATCSKPVDKTVWQLVRTIEGKQA